MARLFFEDFNPGRLGTFGARLVTAGEIKEFASRYDPQPFHLDEDQAAGHLTDGLCAPGMLTCCIMMRLIVDGFLGDSTSMGSPGVEEIRFKKPVRPGDVLRVDTIVLGSRLSRSRPELGFVKFSFEVLNQADEVVARVVTNIMFQRRAASGLVQ